MLMRNQHSKEHHIIVFKWRGMCDWVRKRIAAVDDPVLEYAYTFDNHNGLRYISQIWAWRMNLTPGIKLSASVQLASSCTWFREVRSRKSLKQWTVHCGKLWTRIGTTRNVVQEACSGTTVITFQAATWRLLQRGGVDESDSSARLVAIAVEWGRHHFSRWLIVRPSHGTSLWTLTSKECWRSVRYVANFSGGTSTGKDLTEVSRLNWKNSSWVRDSLSQEESKGHRVVIVAHGPLKCLVWIYPYAQTYKGARAWTAQQLVPPVDGSVLGKAHSCEWSVSHEKKLCPGNFASMV